MFNVARADAYISSVQGGLGYLTARSARLKKSLQEPSRPSLRAADRAGSRRKHIGDRIGYAPGPVDSASGLPPPGARADTRYSSGATPSLDDQLSTVPLTAPAEVGGALELESAGASSSQSRDPMGGHTRPPQSEPPYTGLPTLHDSHIAGLMSVATPQPFCTQCGLELSDNWNFCGHCGTRRK